MGTVHTTRTGVKRGTGREIPALIACLVWAGGFEVAPFLHAIDHDQLAPHEHAAAPDHAAAPEHRHSDGAPDSEHTPDPEHGDGSLAHRGLAAHTAPPALPPIDRPRIDTVRFALELDVLAPARWSERPRARAPPR